LVKGFYSVLLKDGVFFHAEVTEEGTEVTEGFLRSYGINCKVLRFFEKLFVVGF